MQPTSLVYVTVTVDVTHESATGLYVYNYTVTNDFDSQNSLEAFAITPTKDVRGVVAPQHWTEFRGYQGDAEAVVWRVTDNVDVPPPGWDGISVPESPYNPQPGQSTAGFMLKSPWYPQSVTYYAMGFEPMLDESAVPDDEFRSRQPTIYQAGATGTTSGPREVPVVGTQGRETRDRARTGELLQPAPNSAKNVVQISFTLSRETSIFLTIHDVGGRAVRSLATGKFGEGLHSFAWDGKSDSGERVPPGVYFYRLNAGGRTVAERRVVILR